MKQRHALVRDASAPERQRSPLHGDLQRRPRRVPPPQIWVSRFIVEVTVSPEDDAEIRRITLINQGSRARTLELTSAAELSLAPHDADRAHPAFNKLFIQTEARPDLQALLAWRRLRVTR